MTSDRSVIKDKIATVMRFSCYGLKNAKPRSYIMTEIAEDINDRTFRDIYDEMIDEGHLLGSHPKHGYFMITNRLELALANEDLEHKAKSIYGRVHQLNMNYSRVFGCDTENELPLI